MDNRQAKVPKLARTLQGTSFIFLAAILIVTILRFIGSMDDQTFRTVSLLLTLLYFVFGASGMYVREKAFEKESIAQVEEPV